MSIFATWLTIEDEREWIADLQGQGIKAGVIRDGAPHFDDYDAPLIYEGSHVLPGEGAPRGGSVDVAAIPGHVRYWREHPDAPTESEPGHGPPDPYLRLGVSAPESTDGGGGDATVLLTVRQVGRLRDTLTEWIESQKPNAFALPRAS